MIFTVKLEGKYTATLQVTDRNEWTVVDHGTLPDSQIEWLPRLGEIGDPSAGLPGFTRYPNGVIEAWGGTVTKVDPPFESDPDMIY